MENMDVSSPANEDTIPEVLLGLKNAYPNSLDLSGHNFLSNSVTEGKKANFEVDIVVYKVNTTKHPLDDYMEVNGSAVVGINVDQVDIATAEDSCIDTTELLQSVIGNINKTFTIIKNWKAYLDGTWDHLQNGCKKLITVVNNLTGNTTHTSMHEVHYTMDEMVQRWISEVEVVHE
ncbi:hypothetical protein KI387_032472 [Taxus chinensis]|uniref:Uncharacterized protein n=1 Tax=Taxus chinensis TaxID=29808 RepID=A0AA38F459_TAXCH|nr:hypothetical protein KI387_032472 [Taxus chinensis]